MEGEHFVKAEYCKVQSARVVGGYRLARYIRLELQCTACKQRKKESLCQEIVHSRSRVSLWSWLPGVYLAGSRAR